MNTHIQSIDFNLPQELSDFITEKVGKLERFDHRILSAEVHLTQGNSSDSSKICEIRLSIPGNDLFATQHANSFEEALSKTVQALEQQIRKKKE